MSAARSLDPSPIAHAEWRSALQSLHADGYSFLDYLTGIDRGEHVDVVVHVVDPRSADGHLVWTRVTDGVLESIVGVFPGANWHERETAEMLGVQFTGHPDPRPLLLRGTAGVAPLLKATPLPARLETEWPGAVEPGSVPARRRQRTPGVPDAWREVPGE